MDNSISNVNFKASMKLRGIKSNQKLKNVIKIVEQKTSKYPNDTIVINKNGFDVNTGSAGIDGKYIKELLNMPEEKIVKTILKLFSIHKQVEKTETKVPNMVFGLFEKAGVESSSEFDDELFSVIDTVNRSTYRKQALKDPILKHIYFDGVCFN